VCFGKQAGDRVRRRLCANSLVEVFVERNDRRWTSRAYKNSAGLVVLSLTHPSVADWTIPATDPTPLVRKFLAGQ
jgi:hypothetical protein